ncbi:MAG: 2-(1,2-epoxy-1,2-dihydrophenyl)acetyl-CoA isomerase [Ignavibacteria bacterium]|nr:MAG: 2-(1,2-epoxy-1,2-dihydrophenyl)acetyl-CoA isomerase [Ignavibacteria bacterium]
MPSFQTLLYNVTDGVCTITLNRPEVYNAFNEKMKEEFNDALREAGRDVQVRAVVIRGAGEKAFCSGQDLKEHSGSKRSLKESLEQNYNPMIRKIRTMEKPVVAMINGVAAGAGCSLALACDMRLMSTTAKLIEIFIRIGLVPDSGSHWFLPRLVGISRAFEYAATGRDIPADEAERVGLALDLARRLAKAPTKAIGLIKRTLNKALASDLESILEYEALIQQIASGTEDHTEGLRAFIEKRQPVFKGK